MATLIGTNANASHAGACRVKSVTLTPRDAAIDTLELRRYNDLNNPEVFKMKATTGATVQVVFDGIEFPDGVLVVPSATLEGYIVEYDTV